MRRIILIFGIISLVLTSQTVFAYDDKTTHPALTDEAVDFYNLNFSQKLTNEEKEWIIQGSILEDTPPRWVNHFYDPLYKVGWTGDAASLGPEEILRQFTDLFLSNNSAVSALNWVHNQQLQQRYKLYRGNQTWEKAIYEYVKNKNKKEAYYALGYVLHLLEDMAVPDHTRNDTHPGDSPYENYAKQYTRDNLHIIEELRSQQPPILNSLDEYFESVANYSNGYFFSKDTINDPKYNKPKIIDDDGNYAYGLYKDQGELKLSGVRIFFINEGGLLKQIKIYDLKYEPLYYPILDAYWTRLSRASVLNSAGVIRLFFQEAERAEKDPGLLKPSPEGISLMIFSLFGEATKIENLFVDAYGAVKDFTLSGITTISGAWNNLLGSGVNQQAIVFTSATPSTLNVDGTAPSPDLEARLPSGVETPLPIVTPSVQSPPVVQLSPIVVVSSPKNPEPLPSVVLPPAPPPPFVPSLPYPGFGGGGNAAPTNPEVSEVEPPSNSEPEVSVDTTPPTPIDVEGPDIAFSIFECENSISSDGCLLFATTTLHLSWQTAADDLDYFELNFNGSIATTTATSTEIVVLDNSLNIFSIRAKDKTGNWSQTKSQTVEISSMPVVINEVAWAGTGPSHANDEWIELYNRTSKEINLSNWVLHTTSGKPYIPLSGTISANGYYLLERKDNNTVSDIPADFIYGNDGSNWALNNAGEILVLSYASTTIDQTALCGWYSTWCPGYDYKYRSMERIEPDIPGSDGSNWDRNNEVIQNGRNADAGKISATPKKRNSANCSINNGQAIAAEVILKKSRSPYLVNNARVEVPAGATLFIEPGVVIKFYNDAGMSVYGKIIAKGTAEEPVVFTAFSDDEYGGDFNNDATSTMSGAGSWFGVDIVESSIGSVFDHTIFRYGGKWYSGSPGWHRANLHVENTSVQITNSIFEYATVFGLGLGNSDSTVSGNIFRYNNRTGDPAGYSSALLVSGGKPVISSNRFEKNQRGLHIYGQNATVDSNYFESNLEGAIYSSGHLANFTNNSGSGNGINGIYLYGDVADSGLTAFFKPNGLAFVFDHYITVPQNSTLIIEPGVTIKSGGGYQGDGLHVFGNLLVKGENSGDVVFTSLSSNPVPRSWYGVIVHSGGTADIKGATFSYASKAISYENSQIKLENVKFENNNLGVYADEDSIINYQVSAIGVEIEFLGNIATTSPPNLW